MMSMRRMTAGPAHFPPPHPSQFLRAKRGSIMPLFEVETTSHIMIASADDEATARSFARSNYPAEEIIRVAHRPRDAWVISKNLLGVTADADPCSIARECLANAAGDKVHAVRLYMQKTGSDLEQSRKVVETNMSRGW